MPPALDTHAPPAARLRLLIRVALDFWTWRRLDAEGLSDAAAAKMMGEAIEAAAG